MFFNKVSVSPVDDSVVWAITTENGVFKKNDLKWTRIEGEPLQMVSCGFPGVWGVNTEGDVVFREGTQKGVNSAGIKGKCKKTDLLSLFQESLRFC